MFNLTLQGNVFHLAATVAVNTAACSTLVLGSPAVTIVAPENLVLAANAPLEGRAIRTLIAGWADSYELTDAEVETLKSVPLDYDGDEVRPQLRRQLRAMMTCRAVTALPVGQAAEHLEAARFASSAASAREAVGEVDRLATEHAMVAEERARLCAVLTEVPEADWAGELAYEAEGVLAARRIATRSMPTADDMRQIREAMAGTETLPPFVFPND